MRLRNAQGPIIYKDYDYKVPADNTWLLALFALASITLLGVLV